jgi:hypothetical protein
MTAHKHPFILHACIQHACMIPPSPEPEKPHHSRGDPLSI